MSRLNLIDTFGNESAEVFNKCSKAYELGRADERAKVLDLIDRHLWNYSKEVWEDFQPVLEQLKNEHEHANCEDCAMWGQYDEFGEEKVCMLEQLKKGMNNV